MDVEKQARWNFISEVRWPIPVASIAICANEEFVPLTSIGSKHLNDRTAVVRAAHRTSGIRGLTFRRFPLAGGTIVTVDRSAKNISSWSTYLPKDCVATMVSLGWDKTT